MTPLRRWAVAGACAIVVLALLASVPADAAFPRDCRAIRMIVPYTAGGAGDVGARVLAPYMSSALGVPVQVVNIPGAGSQIGVTELVRSKPDGCTIGWTHLPATITIYLNPQTKAVYTFKSFTPLVMYVIDPGAIAVRGDSPWNTLADFVNAAKQRPNQITLSDSGVLSDGHLLTLELQRMTGARFRIVHGRGGAEGTADLLGGHIDAQTINISGANVELFRSGRIKVLGIFDSVRSPRYTGVPTAAEQGFPILSSTSRALSGPAGMPREIIDRLVDAVKTSLINPEFHARALELGITVQYMGPDKLAEYWAKMEQTFGPLVAEYLASQK